MYIVNNMKAVRHVAVSLCVHLSEWTNIIIKIKNTVEHLIVDPPNKGYNRNNLSIKDTSFRSQMFTFL